MSEIKSCFKSRHPDGYLMEIDYSQLEVIGLAYLSGDTQLRRDIIDGIDLHTVNAAKLYNCPESKVTKAQRKIAKAFSFQLQYGAGAKSMAKTNGTSVQLAKDFITNYYHRYPQVKAWQAMIAEDVCNTRKPSARQTYKGLTAGVGHHTSITGRRYVFYEFDNDYARRGESATTFSSTQMKNYPVQGFATGDIVPMMLGELFDLLMTPKYAGQVLLINTVHDSVLLDAPQALVREAAADCKAVLESAPQILKDTFGINFDLPLTCSVEVGRDWGDMKEISI